MFDLGTQLRVIHRRLVRQGPLVNASSISKKQNIVTRWEVAALIPDGFSPARSRPATPAASVLIFYASRSALTTPHYLLEYESESIASDCCAADYLPFFLFSSVLVFLSASVQGVRLALKQDVETPGSKPFRINTCETVLNVLILKDLRMC
jgi:hypothetical protein